MLDRIWWVSAMVFAVLPRSVPAWARDILKAGEEAVSIVA